MKGFSKRVEETQERGSEKEIQVGAGWRPLLLPRRRPNWPNLLAALAGLADCPLQAPCSEDGDGSSLELARLAVQAQCMRHAHTPIDEMHSTAPVRRCPWPVCTRPADAAGAARPHNLPPPSRRRARGAATAPVLLGGG